jgi:lipoprotein-anchoring transpeptidase ErfK/SrfK
MGPMHGTTTYAGGGTGGSAKKHFDNDSFWIGDQMRGSPSIKIVLGEQKAYFYKGGKLAGIALISTGSEGHPTQAGSFSIQELDRDHKSTEYGNYLDANDKVIQSDVDTTKDPLPPGAHFEGAGMPFFMRFNGGTGMHEGFMPGYADSHGCIRMPGWIAEEFFNAVDVGTPVTVVH